MRRQLLAATLALLSTTAACGQAGLPFQVEPVAAFDQPWALAFLPDGTLLVTEQRGQLLLVSSDGSEATPVAGVPEVAYGGQGGLGDVALHPDFEDNGLVYLSYAEAGVGDTRGAAVARGVLRRDDAGARLTDLAVIWRQYPKVFDYGHYGHRLAFDGDGYLWITSGERQKFTPAQDMQSNLGKVLRLHDDGSVPDGNPFVNYLEEEPLVDGVGVYGEI